MAVDSRAGLIIGALLFLSATTRVCGYETVLTLKRSMRPNHEVGLTQLRAFDSARHGRLLHSPARGAFHFPVEGNANPVLTSLYYTTVKLGTPPREFNVQIDTGSDGFWVSCTSCVGCPKNSNRSFFDPGASSSALKVPCSDRRCYSNTQKKSGCSPQKTCSYKLEYADGSVTSGYYVSDVISFDTLISSTLTINSSAPFVFGCSNLTTGPLSLPRIAVDGILGLGQGPLSVISQLSTQGLAPLVFSLCLNGDKDGGGVMVLGQNKRPNTVYTPLVPSQTHYSVNLQSIAVNDQILPIDPSVFTVATGYGTIIDSGTILSYFPVEAYDPLIQVISNAVLRYGHPITFESYQCYNFTSRKSSYDVVADMFPEVSLRFAGGASMVLKPQAYLFQLLVDFGGGGVAIPCISFQTMPSGRITVLGESTLIDKMIVFDLDHQQFGWAEYNCSLDVTRGRRNKDIIYTRPWRENSAESGNRSYLLQVALIPLLLHLLLCLSFSFW